MKKLFTIILMLLAATAQLMADTYVVTVAKANVRDKASTTGKIIGTLQKGLEIEVDDCVDGFARFNFMGHNGYTALKLLKKVTPEAPAPAEQTPEAHQTSASVSPVSDTEAVIYLFYDVKFYLKSMPISFNGQHVFGMEGKETTSKMTGTRYEPSMRKITVHGEGRMIISCDYTWADKPYHSEIALDITDGSTYFVQMHIENLVNVIAKKRSGIYFKQLKPKDGLKMLKKDKFTVNPDFDYYLQ